MRHLHKRVAGSMVVLSACLLAIVLGPAPTATDNMLVVDHFSGAKGRYGLPAGWKPFEFSLLKQPTQYMLARVDGGYALKAFSRNAASAIFKEVRLDLREYPILSWRWKVGGTYANGNALVKEGDDYAARVYVAFEFEEQKASRFEQVKHGLFQKLYKDVKVPGKAIAYIWANRLEREQVVPNPYLDRTMMVAVESGDEKTGQWVYEERNVLEDFRRCFKGEPPMVAGIIIMTDTDNTRGLMTSFYDDIVFRRKPSGGPISVKKSNGAQSGG